MNKHLKSLLMTKEKVLPKVRKLNTIIVEVWDIMLMIVIVPKMSKSLCRQYGVTQDSEESASTTSEATKYDPNDL